MTTDKELQLDKNNDRTIALALEKDPILELFDISNKYLKNLEDNISSFLKQHWININNVEDVNLKQKISSYDWNINNRNINNIEKIKKIQDTIKVKKEKIEKFQLTSNLITSLILTNSKEYVDVKDIFQKAWKEDIFKKNQSSFLQNRRNEEKDFRKEILEASKKIEEKPSVVVENYTTTQVQAKNRIEKIAKTLNIDISKIERKDLYNVETLKKFEAKLINHITEKQKTLVEKLSKHTKESSVTLQIQRELEANNKLARDFWVEKQVNIWVWKYVERWLQSGILPLWMMASKTLKKALPTLPAVIWVWVWARLVNGSINDKLWALWETALAIAPITGTYVAYKDAMNAKTTWDKIAAWTGFAVSAWFDAFTVFLVATWVWAPAAVWTQALKVTARESAKLAMKKVTSFFTKEVAENAPRVYGTLWSVWKEYLKWKVNVVTNAVKELWIKEFTKRVWQQTIKETAEWMWNILTFKWLRETKYLSKYNNATFGKAADATKWMRVWALQKLEKVGIVKNWASNRVAAAWTIEEIRLLNHESNQAHRPEDIETLSRENEYRVIEENMTTKNLDLLQQKIEALLKNKDTDPRILQNAFETLKLQDVYMWNAMDVVKDVSSEVININELHTNREQAIKNIEEIFKKNETKISKWLKTYLEWLIKKLKSGEDFGYNTWNFLALQNKFNWQISVNAYKNEWNTKAVNEYQDLIKSGETESTNWYAWNYVRNLDFIENLLKSWEFKWEKYEILLKWYLDIVKNAEKTWRWTIRLELLKTDPALWINEKITNWDIHNWYEYFVHDLMIKNIGKEWLIINNNVSSILKQIDFSMIHSPEYLRKIIDISYLKIESIYKTNPKEAFEIIWILWNNPSTKELLKNRFYAVWRVAWEEQDILMHLADNTKSNVQLIKIIDFIKANRDRYRNKIIENVRNNDQINPKVWEKIAREDIGKKWVPMTKEQLDITLRDLKKLSLEEWKKSIYNSVWWSYKVAFDTIIQKVTWKDISNESIQDFTKYLESYDVVASFYKLYSADFPIETHKLISDSIKWRYASIEYKIKLLEDLWEPREHLLDLSKELLSNRHSKDSFIKKIDRIEQMFETYKNDPEFKDILSKIDELKSSRQYKKQDEKVSKNLLLLLDLDRAHNEDFLIELKNNWWITYKTLDVIQSYIDAKVIYWNDWITYKSLSDVELKKLEIVRNQVKNTLEQYEFNLFDKLVFEKSPDQVKYLYDVIDQQAWWKLTNGSEDGNKLVKLMTRQLNTLNTNFDIKPEIINWFLYKVLWSSDPKWLDIANKINLLKVLEKTWIISPSIEQKIEYIISLSPKNAQDLRSNASIIKDYTKNFDDWLKKSNTKILELKANWDKEAIENYVRKTIKDRVPVTQDYINTKPELREWIDYINIEWKIYITDIYPSRYFMSQLLSLKDIKQKETYMELIHNKNEFGWKSFREYFNETTDIETKIIMSYHDSIKYDTDVIDFLKKYANDPKYSNTIRYALEKRKDFDLIKWWEWENLNRWLLENIITKDYFENKSWEKLDDAKFIEIRDRLISLIISIKDFNNAQIWARELDEAYLEISKIENTNEVKIKNLDSIINDYQKSKSSISELLKDNALSNIVNSSRWLDEEQKNDKKLLKWINGEYLKWTERLWTSRRWEAWLLLSAVINSNELLEAQEKWNNLNISKDIANIEIDVKWFKLPEWKILNVKTLLGLFILKWLMTPTEAQAKAQEINNTWEKHPEFERYQALEKAGKAKEALELKQKIIREITNMVLKNYIKDFQDNYEAKMEIKINEFPDWLKTLVADFYDRWKKLLKNPDEKDLSKFVYSIYSFADSIDKWKWTSEKIAMELEIKFPELKWTNYMDLLISIWKNTDIIVKNNKIIRDNQKKIEERDKIIEKLKKL